MGFAIFIFIININLIFSFILEKGDSIKTNFNSLLFDSKEFFIGAKMEFKFTPNNYCDNILYYGYYDDSSNAVRQYEAPFYVLSSKKKDKILYFTIEKKVEELNGLDGVYLLLKYNCNGLVEIENLIKKINTTSIILIVVACLAFIGIIVIVIIIYCYKKKCKNDTNIQINNNIGNENNVISNNNNIQISNNIENENNIISNDNNYQISYNIENENNVGNNDNNIQKSSNIEKESDARSNGDNIEIRIKKGNENNVNSINNNIQMYNYH